MKHDLKDVTFIIPLQIETDDRLRNIILTTSFLLNTFDTNVIIKEVDEEPIFQQWALPAIKRIVGDTSGKTIFLRNIIVMMMLSTALKS